MPPRSKASVPLALAMLLGIAFVAVPPLGLWMVRDRWIEEWSRPEAREQWDEFRGAMRRQTGRDGPVQRKVPRSEEPPQLVWLRDYFPLACAAWVVFGGVLWMVTAIFVLGTIRRSVGSGSLSENESCREGHDQKQHDRDAEDTKKR